MILATRYDDPMSFFVSSAMLGWWHSKSVSLPSNWIGRQFATVNARGAVGDIL